MKKLLQWRQSSEEGEAIGGELISQSEPASTQLAVPALVAEWQENGPETLCGHTARKLRLVLALSQSAITASAGG